MATSYKFKGIGLSTAERNTGKKRFEEYLEVYPHLNKISLLTLLEELIFLELINDSIKLKIRQLTNAKSVKTSTAVPSKLLKELQDNLTQILNLKSNLGLFEEKEKLDAYKDIENLKKKFETYREEHSLSFKTTCPFCSEIYFLKRKTENYEPHISPFFENKILINRPLMDLYFAKKITKKETSQVLGTSPDYIDWLIDKFFKKQK